MSTSRSPDQEHLKELTVTTDFGTKENGASEVVEKQGPREHSESGPLKAEASTSTQANAFKDKCEGDIHLPGSDDGGHQHRTASNDHDADVTKPLIMKTGTNKIGNGVCAKCSRPGVEIQDTAPSVEQDDSFEDEENDQLDYQRDEEIVPDGGWGWMVCFGSFLVNFILDGTMFSFGVLLLDLLEDFGTDKSTTSWVGSAQMGVHMCMGPVISELLKRYSIRQVTIAGSIVASVAFIVSVFSPNIYVLILCFGVVGGVGFGLSFLPAIIVVGLYFNRKRAIATGIATSGSGVGTFAFGYITDLLLREYGWRGTVLILAGILLNCAVCGMLFRPLLTKNVSVRKKVSKPQPTAPTATYGNTATNQGDHHSSSSGYSSDVHTASGKRGLATTKPHDHDFETDLLTHEEEHNCEEKKNGGDGVDKDLYLEIGSKLSQKDVPISVAPVGDELSECVCFMEKEKEQNSTTEVQRDANKDSERLLDRSDGTILHEKNDVNANCKHKCGSVSTCTSEAQYLELVDTNDKEPYKSKTPQMKANKNLLTLFKDANGIKTGQNFGPRLYKSVDHLHSLTKSDKQRNSQMNFGATQKPGLPDPRLLSSDYKLQDLGGARAMSLYALRNSQSHFHHFESKPDVHNQVSKGLLRPILRKDIYYGGSVSHLPQYQHFGGSIATFMAAMTRRSSTSEDDPCVITKKTDPCLDSECCKGLAQILPVRLLTNKTFLLLLVTFTMWTAQSVSLNYVPDLAVTVGIDKTDAAFLISIVGIANVLGRLMAGLINDCFRLPSIWLYVTALLTGSLVNLLFPFCTSYVLLQACSAVFGLCMAVAVSMRTIVLAEQLGIEVLTESFGIVALFQGVAFTINPPIAGKLIDELHSFKPPFIMAAVMYAISGISALMVGCMGRSKVKKLEEVSKLQEMEMVVESYCDHDVIVVEEIPTENMMNITKKTAQNGSSDPVCV